MNKAKVIDEIGFTGDTDQEWLALIRKQNRLSEIQKAEIIRQEIDGMKQEIK